MSESTYLFVSNGNDSACDGKEGEYEEEPDRPHPNCACKIEEKRRERGCISMELELGEVDEPDEDGGDEEPPTYNDDPDDPNNPKLEIDELPPGFDVHPPRPWNQVDLDCTFHYTIECANGFTRSGDITVSLNAGTRLDSQEAYESIIVPFLLEGAEDQAWSQVEAIADEAVADGECGCIA